MSRVLLWSERYHGCQIRYFWDITMKRFWMEATGHQFRESGFPMITGRLEFQEIREVVRERARARMVAQRASR